MYVSLFIRLHGARKTIEPFGVVVHQLELEFDHALHNVQIGVGTHCEPSFDSEFVIDSRIGSHTVELVFNVLKT